jgi:hypothetical protein
MKIKNVIKTNKNKTAAGNKIKDKDKKPKHDLPYSKIKEKIDKVKQQFPDTWNKRCGFITGITSKEGRKRGLYKMLYPDQETKKGYIIFK